MKKYLPHLVAVAAFLLLTVIFFAPLFGGKELRQSDINNWRGMSKEINDFKEKTAEQTLWTNSMFGGMPAYQISAVYSANLVQYLDRVIMFLPSPANLFFLYMIGFYFLLIMLGVDVRVAIIGSMAFAFSTYLIVVLEAGHNTKAHAIGYMAPVIAGIIMTFRGRLWLGAAITGLALALELYANHLQISYYLMLMVMLLGIAELYMAWKEKRLAQFAKAVGLLACMALLAAATNITNLWATQEYGKYSTRGPSELTVNQENKTSGLDKDYITDWSYGVGESFTLIVPNFKGGASEAISKNNKDALKSVDPNFRQNIAGYNAYFGDQPFTLGPVYLGAIICLFFVIGLFVVKGPMKWWLLAATLLSLMLSWGKHFMALTDLFLDHVPGYDKFRAVTMILVIAEFTVPLLAVLALDKIVKENDFFTKYKKQIMYALGGVVGLVLLISLAPGTFTSFYTQEEYNQVVESTKGQNVPQDVIDSFFNNLSQARKHILESDAMRTLILLLIASALLWTFLRYRYSKEIFLYGLMVLVLADLAFVARRYLGPDDFVKKSVSESPWTMSAADQAIKQDTAKSYRVLNVAVNTFNDASTSFFHQSIGGYHGAKLKRYKELIDYRLTPEINALKTGMQRPDSGFRQTLSGQSALNMLNTKYIIYNPEAPPLQNPGALGNAWLVREYRLVQNADSEIAALNTFNPRATAIVDERFKEQLSGWTYTPDSPAGNTSSAAVSNAQDNIMIHDQPASITLTSYAPNHLTYSFSAKSEQLAVFSEIYYDKGWTAYVDGKPTPYFCTDYVLRGMRIPAGVHTIEWKFDPPVVKTGEKISLASSALLLLIVAGMGWMEWKKKVTV